MGKFFKPSSFALYFLSFLFFFILGAFVAGLLGVGKNQGLASGAIVFGYGISIGVIAFLLAIVLVIFFSETPIIRRINIGLLLLLILSIAWLYLQFDHRKEENLDPDSPNIPIETTPPVSGMTFSKVIFHLNEDKSMGIGFFSPNEIVVNEETRQTAVVDRFKGRIIHWPEFILNVFDVEFLNHSDQNIYFKPLDYASKVNVIYSIMVPMAVQGDWLKVDLLDEALNLKGQGWIKWRKGEILEINYNLLS